jgi:hypothetical protein
VHPYNSKPCLPNGSYTLITSPHARIFSKTFLPQLFYSSKTIILSTRAHGYQASFISTPGGETLTFLKCLQVSEVLPQFKSFNVSGLLILQSDLLTGKKITNFPRHCPLPPLDIRRLKYSDYTYHSAIDILNTSNHLLASAASRCRHKSCSLQHQRVGTEMNP